MSQDPKSTLSRRRSRGLSLHQRLVSAHHTSSLTSPQPQSQHTSDPFLRSFLSPSFDAASYLNSTLPPLKSTSSATTNTDAVSLTDLDAQAQTLLSQIGAHTTRLTDTLTQLTDEILRSGSRLAYEVELLRGETLGLCETLGDDGLSGDAELFVPGGMKSLEDAAAISPAVERRMSVLSLGRRASGVVGVDAHPQAPGGADNADASAAADADKSPDTSLDPPYITQLRTLLLVRRRLDSVIKILGDAMAFTFPPSQVSTSSSFLSVSAPAMESVGDSHADGRGSDGKSIEERGQQVLKELREEITRLLNGQGLPESSEENPSLSAAERKTALAVRGIEAATDRIESLKELSIVWKGTAEEKGRAKFVDELAKMVEDRHRELVRQLDQQQLVQGTESRRSGDGSARNGEAAVPAMTAAAETKAPALGGYGFISQLQKIRSGL